MLSNLIKINTDAPSPSKKEGDLYKIIRLYGKTFEIRYGFYEERDRHSKYAEPIEIYPNFIKEPQYTDEGHPFATAIQSPCPYFSGKTDENSCCGDCLHYKQCEELMGICLFEKNKQTLQARGVMQNE